MSEHRLQRYSMEKNRGCTPYCDDNHGKWVKWQDVEPLLQAYLSIVDDYNKIKDIVKGKTIKITL